MNVYADNAATTRLSNAAKYAMINTYDRYWGNPSSLYRFGQEAAEELYKAREIVARCICCLPQEVTFTSGGSEADTQAVFSAARRGEKRGKKHLISTKIEHHAVLHALGALEKQGFEVTLLDVTADGLVRPEDVADAIRDDTALVSVMYANNEIGTIQPIRKIGEICRGRGVLFHTDAVQAVGHIPVDFEADQIDLLSLAAHKFGGPKGVGALIARKGVLLESVIYGGAQERGKRAGTENLPAIAGMAAALDEACFALEKNAAYVSGLRDRLIEGIRKIPHTAVNGSLAHRLPGNVNVCFEGIEGESLLLLLDREGISASSGSACTSGSLDPSHVLLAIGRPHEVAHGSLRLTIGPDNTPEEMEYILEAVPKVVDYLRNMSPVWEELEKGGKPHVI